MLVLLSVSAHQVHAQVLTLAIADVPLLSPALIAEAEGYYAAEGLNLKIIHTSNGRQALQHLLDGQAQLATVADLPIVLTSLAGSRFDILATLTIGRDHRMIARADRGITSPVGLKGKRVGYVKGTTSQYFADIFLVFNNVDPTQVQRVPLDSSQLVEALVKGDVDAASLYEPFGQRALIAMGSGAITMPNLKTFSITINMVSAKAGVSDSDAAKLLRAINRAHVLIQKNPAKAQAIVATMLNLDATALARIWGDYDFSLSLAQPLINNFEAVARWALREGMVSGGKLPDYLDYIRSEPLQSIDPRAATLVK